MTRKEYVLLYEKVISGRCTPEEKALLDEYRDNFSLEVLYWDEHILGNQKEITQNIYQKLSKSIGKRKQLYTDTYWYMAAAVLFAIMSVVLYLYIIQYNHQQALKQNHAIAIKKAMASGQVLISSSDGSNIILADTDKGILANQDNVLIRKDSARTLVYDASAAISRYDVKYNTIVIPKRKEYQVLLPDGSKVWLNSESSLKFPVAFVGKTREVELTGEAYFEVAKNKEKPFIVTVNDTKIEVLGTQFNVNAYTSMINTTLVEGSVKLNHKDKEVVLKPGQSGINTNDRLIVRNADVEEITAWKNGYFVFRDESIQSIMEKISRWYDIIVQYEGDVGQRAFYGKVSKYDDVADLLKSMEMTGIVKFKLMPQNNSSKGRRIIVMP